MTSPSGVLPSLPPHHACGRLAQVDGGRNHCARGDTATGSNQKGVHQAKLNLIETGVSDDTQETASTESLIMNVS